MFVCWDLPGFLLSPRLILVPYELVQYDELVKRSNMQIADLAADWLLCTRTMLLLFVNTFRFDFYRFLLPGAMRYRYVL